MAKQTFTIGQVLTAAEMTSLQQTAMGGGSTTDKTVSYTLVAADAGTVVQMNSASATTITVNTALFSAGDTVQIQNVGAGVCTVTAGTATVSTAGSLALSQYEGGQLYFNTTSAALFFDIVQTSGMTNPLTTTGDTIYSSSGTTPARLGIGSTGQVLTVASGLPSWATPASGSTFVGCSVYTSNITLTTGTYTAVTWDSEAYDTDAIHSTASNTSRFTIPTGKSGKWLMTSNLEYNTNSTSYRANRVKVNNTTFYADNYYPPTAANETSCVMSLVMNLTAADYVEIFARQDTGGNLLLIGGAYGSWAMFTYLGA